MDKNTLTEKAHPNLRRAGGAQKPNGFQGIIPEGPRKPNNLQDMAVWSERA
jgi:hypothetical protein